MEVFDLEDILEKYVGEFPIRGSEQTSLLNLLRIRIE